MLRNIDSKTESEDSTCQCRDVLHLLRNIEAMTKDAYDSINPVGLRKLLFINIGASLKNSMSLLRVMSGVQLS